MENYKVLIFPLNTTQAMMNERTKSKTAQEQYLPIKNSKPQTPSEMVDPSLVQITASKAEVDRRIAGVLRKKQLDVNIHNQREFCNLLDTENG
jgi:hypothetical protein